MRIRIRNTGKKGVGETKILKIFWEKKRKFGIFRRKLEKRETKIFKIFWEKKRKFGIFRKVR